MYTKRRPDTRQPLVALAVLIALATPPGRQAFAAATSWAGRTCATIITHSFNFPDLPLPVTPGPATTHRPSGDIGGHATQRQP
jgi:hypothetical protein